MTDPFRSMISSRTSNQNVAESTPMDTVQRDTAKSEEVDLVNGGSSSDALDPVNTVPESLPDPKIETGDVKVLSPQQGDLVADLINRSPKRSSKAIGQNPDRNTLRQCSVKIQKITHNMVKHIATGYKSSSSGKQLLSESSQKPHPPLPTKDDELSDTEDAGGTSVTNFDGAEDPTHLEGKLAALQTLGLVEQLKNIEALQKFNYDLELTANYLLGQESPTDDEPQPSTSRSCRMIASKGHITPCSPTSSTETSSTSEPSCSNNGNEPVEEDVKGNVHIVTIQLQPPNWIKNLNVAEKSIDDFKMFPVDKTTMEHETITELIHPLTIVSIEQVVNPYLWERYVNKRKELLIQKSGNSNIMQLEKLILNSPEVQELSESQMKSIKDKLSKPTYANYSTNDTLLLYCPRSDQHLDKILEEGLDLDDTSMNGFRQGNGFICFADDPLLPVKHDGTNRGSGSDPIGTIIIFTVVLGDCLYQEKFPGEDKICLDYQPGKVAEIHQRNPDDICFDSITSMAPLQFKGGGGAATSSASASNLRKGKTFNEYVIFNKEQCCPLYLIKFRRDHVQPSGALANNAWDGYYSARRRMPTMAWRYLPRAILHLVPVPNLDLDKEWPFYADNIFQKMNGIFLTPPQGTSQGSDQDQEDA